MEKTIMNRASRALLVLVVGAAVGRPARASSTSTPINVPVFLKEPVGIAYNPDNNHIYVLDIRPTFQFYSSGYVHIIDAGTNTFIRTVVVGQFSKGIAYDGYHHKVYVTNSLDSNVSVIDTNNDFPLADSNGNAKKISVIRDPAAIAMSYYTSYVYVTYHDNVRNIPAVAVIDGATDTVIGNISGFFDAELTGIVWPVHGSVAHMMFALGGGAPAKVFRIQPFGGGGSFLGTTFVQNSQSTPFSSMYRAMAGENSRGLTYVVNNDSSSVSAIDGYGGVAATIPVPGTPVAIAGEDHWVVGGGHVWVACRDNGTVVEISEHHVTRTWTGFTRPTAIQFNPSNHSLYVADSQRVYVIHI
jgi:DNA-binding beta-propeller fold protein YncE